MSTGPVIKAGLDDTGSGVFKGYGCIMLRDAAAAELEREGRKLLAAAGLPEFHGREFNPDNQNEVVAYEAFARLIGKGLEKHVGYVAVQFIHDSVYRSVFAGMAPRLTSSVMTALRGRPSNFCDSKAGAMFFLARTLAGSGQPADAQVLVELDPEQESDLAESQRHLGLRGNLGGSLTPAADALVQIANSYKRQQFPKGPAIGRLELRKSEQSILIQAADVVANFGLSQVKECARGGAQGGTRERERARIFRLLGPIEQGAAVGALSVDANNNLVGSEDDNVLIQIGFA